MELQNDDVHMHCPQSTSRIRGVLNTVYSYVKGSENVVPVPTSDPIESTQADVSQNLMGTFLVGDPECTFEDVADILQISSSKKLIKRWKQIARALETTEETIAKSARKLNLDYDNHTEIYIDILIEWRSKKSKQATLDALANILYQKGCPDSAGRLLKAYAIYHGSTIEQEKKRQTCKVIAGVIFLVALSVVVLRAVLLVTQHSKIDFKSTLSPVSSYYMTRELKSRSIISNDSISKSGDAVLVFSDIDSSEVIKLVPFGGTCSTQDILQEQAISCNYITDLQSNAEFDKLCLIRDKLSVHWLQYQINTSTFKWVRSCGDMEFIQSAAQYSYNKSEESIFKNLQFFTSDTSQIIQNTGLKQPKIIYGSSGFGKSSLLARIGTIAETHGNITIVFTKFPSFLDKVAAANKSISQNHSFKSVIVEVLVEMACKNKACKRFIQGGLPNSGIKVLLLLDALDALSYKTFQEAQKVLIELKSWNSTLLVVTSGPKYLVELENTLESMSYEIEPFSRERQVEFLFGFWNSSTQGLDKDKLLQFSKTCVTKFESTLSQEENSFTGIALLTTIIAQVYQENATSYANSDESVRCPKCIPTVYTTIFNLFEGLIDQKFRSYTDNSVIRRILEMYHYYQAVSTLYPNIVSVLKSKPIEGTMTSYEVITKIGILEYSRDNPNKLQFIHATFANFFAARYLIHCNMTDLLCSSIFNASMDVTTTANSIETRWHMLNYPTFTFTQNLVTYFLDASNQSQNLQVFYQGTRSNQEHYLFAALENDYKTFFKTFLNVYLNSVDTESAGNLFPGVVTTELVVRSILFGKANLARTVLTRFVSQYPHNEATVIQNITVECFKPLKGSKHCTLLHLAVLRGNYEIFLFIWPYFGSKSHGKYILHNVVAESFDKKALNVERNKMSMLDDIMKSVGDQASDLLNESNAADSLCAPIFYASSSYIIAALISKGADPTLTCKRVGANDTILHVSAHELKTNKDFYEVVLAMHKKERLLSTIVNKETVTKTGGETALEQYIMYHELFNNTLALFESASANFSLQRESSDNIALTSSTLFGLGIKRGRNQKSLKLLMHYVPVWQRTGHGNSTVLSFAVKYNHVSAAGLMLKQNESSIDQRDWRGWTPLFSIFADNCNHDLSENSAMLQFLMVNGADPNSLHEKNRVTPFQMALTKANLKTIKYLITRGAGIDYEDSEGNSALHYALSPLRERFDNNDTVKFLVHDKNIPINIRNNKNMTALERLYYKEGYLRFANLDLIRFLAQNGAVTSSNLGHQIIDKMIPGSIGYREGFLMFRDTLADLRTAGVDLNFVYSDNSTYLHRSVEFECLICVDSFLAVGLDVNAKDSLGNTPLSYTHQSNNEVSHEIQKKLIENGGQ